MASLTETSIISRKIIRYGIYLLIFALIARFSFNLIRTIYLRIFPPPPPEATLVFGKLPFIPFPEKEFPENLTFRLETTDGQFPQLLDQLPVYEMPPAPQNLTALEDAKTKASRLDFDPNGRPILETTPNVYIFQKRNAPSTMTMNIITGIFSISYDFAQDPTILTGVPMNEESAKDQVKSYLTSAGILFPDLSTGRYTHQFYRADSTDLVETESLSESNFVKVNVFRKNYGLKGEIESVTPEMPEANIWFMLGASLRHVVSAEFHHYPIDETKFGTYPLKSAEQGWNDLNDKKAFIVSAGDNPNGNIIIRKIYLGYYDAGQFQEYYQPVLVYEGDNGFLAFVPAVIDEHYGKTTEAAP